MIPNAMSLKAKIKNLAKQTGAAPQALLQAFFFERFLERLIKSSSHMLQAFVLKIRWGHCRSYYLPDLCPPCGTVRGR